MSTSKFIGWTGFWLTLVLLVVIAVKANCIAWGCYGGPCVTSAACVAGCHCIQGTCG